MVPSEIAALRAQGAPALAQMLYTFTHAATTGRSAPTSPQLKHALPAGAVVNWASWLTARARSARNKGSTPRSRWRSGSSGWCWRY